MISLFEFCKKIFKVGCIGFGGGNALVPVFESVFFKDGSLPESATTYDKDVIVANITPGALLVEISSSLGRHNFGIKGMLLGPTLFTLPGIIGAAILFLLMTSVQSVFLNYINVAAIGISAFIAALLVDYIATVLKKKKASSQKLFIRSIIIMLVVAALTCGKTVYKLLGLEIESIFSVSTINVLLAIFFFAFWNGKRKDFLHLGSSAVLMIVFLLGKGNAAVFENVPIVMYITEALMVILAVYGFFSSFKFSNVDIKIEKGKLFTDFGVLLAFALVLSLPAIIIFPECIAFLGKAMLSTVMSFGGGDAYLTIADGMFVQSGIVSEDTFYSQIVTVINVLPGSILCKTLFGIGYYSGLGYSGSVLIGLLTGLAGFACSVSASCIAFFVIYYLYDGLTEIQGFALLSNEIRTIVGGLLIKVILSLYAQGFAVSDTFSVPFLATFIFVVALSAANYIMKKKDILSSVWLILIDIALAALFFILL